MPSKAIDDLQGMVVMLVFIPIFFALDDALFSFLESSSGLPFAALFLVIIAFIEVLGYIKFFREILGI